MKINGRAFGDINIPENLMDDERFDKVGFYRWLVLKNNDAKSVLKAKRNVNDHHLL